MLLGKGDADLHRPAGMHRVKGAEQLLPHRHHIDKIVKDGAKLFFGFHRIQPVAVALAVGRGNFKGRMHHKRRDVQLLCPAINLLPGDLIEPRHRGIGLIERLLLGHCQYRADVLLGGGDFLAVEGFCQRRRPLVAILHAGRHFLPHHACHINRFFALFQRGGALFRTAGQHQGGKQR